jgi:integrase
MPGSVHTVTRTTRSGKRYIVRYRRGGRGYRLEHAGSFKRQDVARERERLVGGWLAAGLDPREELAKLGADEEERTTVAKVGREWLESRLDLAEQSQRVYTTYLDSIEASPLGGSDPTRIEPGDVRAQVARWAADGLAPKSVRERVSVLRQVLDFSGVEPNPARHRTVRLPARAETELVLPSAGDIVVLATNLPAKYRLPFVILEQTAMRISELVSLERDDVDAAALRFRVKAVNRKGVRGSRRARFVPVPPWVMEIVATSLPIRGRLFPEFAADGLRASMRDLCESKGLAHCTPHRLRHRRISLWHFQGVPARELADRAGHSKPSMSLDVYSHVIVPDEVDPEVLKTLVVDDETAAKRRARDAPVMHSPTP